MNSKNLIKLGVLIEKRGARLRSKSISNTFFIDDYFVISGKDTEYYIKLNGHNQLNYNSVVAFNCINGQWYFKVVA